MPTTDSNDCGLTRERWWSGRCPWFLVAVSDGHDSIILFSRALVSHIVISHVFRALSVFVQFQFCI
jgi:hypothetical protein